jgi:hypothetical protein
MLPAYQRETEICRVIADADIAARIGLDFPREQLGVGHAGWLYQSHADRALECRRWESALSFPRMVACYHPGGGPNETHVRRSSAIKEGTRAHTEATPTNRRSARGTRKRQLQRRITHDIRSRSSQDKPGAESAMGKGEGSRPEAEENDVSSSPKENRGGATRTLGEVEERSINESPGGVTHAYQPIWRIRSRMSTL